MWLEICCEKYELKICEENMWLKICVGKYVGKYLLKICGENMC